MLFGSEEIFMTSRFTDESISNMTDAQLAEEIRQMQVRGKEIEKTTRGLLSKLEQDFETKRIKEKTYKTNKAKLEEILDSALLMQTPSKLDLH